MLLTVYRPYVVYDNLFDYLLPYTNKVNLIYFRPYNLLETFKDHRYSKT